MIQAEILFAVEQKGLLEKDENGARNPESVVRCNEEIIDVAVDRRDSLGEFSGDADGTYERESPDDPCHEAGNKSVTTSPLFFAQSVLQQTRMFRVR